MSVAAGTSDPELSPRSGRMLWYGPDLAADESLWVHRLSLAELGEIEAAAVEFDRGGADLVRLDAAGFPLPRLAGPLAAIREELLHGRGLYLLRGLRLDRLTRRQAAIAFYGVGAHLGEAVSQNARGHVLGHVRDLGFDYHSPTARGYQTAARLPYHTDGSDLAALLCLATARRGGLSSIVSALAIFNAMVTERPDLAAVLTEPLYRDRRGEIPAGAKPWYRMPAFNLHQGRVITSYVRSAVRKAQAHPDVPRLTALQEEAMDRFDALAADPALHLDMVLEPGDMQFVNNHYVLHSRTAFEDHPEPERRRHLLRLWLACEDGPALPPAPFEEFQGLNATGRPNGYLLDGVTLNAPLDAVDGGPGESGKRYAPGAGPPAS